MLPTTLVSMKSVAQLDITTYSRYQARNAIVHGHHEARGTCRRSSRNSSEACSSS